MFDELTYFEEMIIKGKYFEAHEALEEKWIFYKKINSKLQYAYKGLINAAVSLELKKRGRKRQTYLKVWKVYEKYKPFYTIEGKIQKTARFLEKYKP